MPWIFLSPHLDDAVLSCGGLIYELVACGDEVQIWTICAGDAPPGPLSPLAQELHARWQTGPDAPRIRRAEDLKACGMLGAKSVHLDIPECIYRRRQDTGLPLIGSNDELFQPLPEIEAPLVAQIAGLLSRQVEEDARLVSPLAIGGHIDHHLVRRAAEALHRPLLYYADYPYLEGQRENMNRETGTGWEICPRPISRSGLAAWQSSVACYRTQISTFWKNLAEMRAALQRYHAQGGGARLWSVHPSPLHRNYKTVK